ncbi:hypothetical protein K470DRAFT_205608, partial [Piedraia hortae CBS 480.64]
GHIIDYCVSKILFATSGVCTKLDTDSDHHTLPIHVPGRETEPVERLHYRVHDKKLPEFADVIALHMSGMLSNASTPKAVEQQLRRFEGLWEDTLSAVGHLAQERARSAPGLTPECQHAHK